jgi:hypothetical protein
MLTIPNCGSFIRGDGFTPDYCRKKWDVCTRCDLDYEYDPDARAEEREMRRGEV